MTSQLQFFLFLQTCLFLYLIFCDSRLLSAFPADSDNDVLAKEVEIKYFNRTRGGALSKLTDDTLNPILSLPKKNAKIPLGQRISRRGGGGFPSVDASPLRQQAPIEEEDDEWDDTNNDKTKTANGNSARNQKENTLPSPPSATESSINSDRWAAVEKGIFIKSNEPINYVGDNFCVDTGSLYFTFNKVSVIIIVNTIV